MVDDIRGWMVALALVGAFGCSGDFADMGDPLGDGGTGGNNDAGTSTAPPSPSDDETGGLDDSGAASGGSGEDPSGPDGADTGELEVCDIDCGPGGQCDLDNEDTPYCSCFPGYAAYGLQCLECTSTPGPVQVQIPVVQVTASYTLNGESFPASIYERGMILLRDPATGDEVELGSTRWGGTQEPVPVIPGTYEIYYSHELGGQQVPQNRGARVTTVRIPSVDTFELEIDVPAIQISGDILLGGQTPPDSIYDNGDIVLRHDGTGDEIPLGQTKDGLYSATVIPGAYDIHYRNRLASNVAPVNQDAEIGQVFVFDAVEGSQDVDIDVPVATLSGSFTLDGAAPPDSIYENAQILLRDLNTGDELVLGQTRDGSYEGAVVPGPYQVIYRRLQGGDQVPVNSAALLEEVTVAEGDQPLDINVPTAVITGTITVGGSAAPNDPSNDGQLVLRNPVVGDEAVLGSTHDGVYTRRVVRGQYDVHYRQQTSSGLVPANTNAWLQSIDVQGGANFPIDVPVVTVSASVTLNGALPPDSAYDDGLLYLRDEQSGDTVLLGNTRLASLQRPVVPGTYDLVYVVEAAGPTVPINAQAHLATVDVAATPQLEVDIPVTSMGGPITVAGGPPPVSIYEQADLQLTDVATQDVIYLGRIAAGAFGRQLAAGTYVLAYRGISTQGTIPANANAGLACIELTSP